MDNQMTLRETAEGKAVIVVARDAEEGSFETHAQAFVERFRLPVKEKAPGPAHSMWVAMFGDHELCISWDDWCSEVIVMAWGDTPDEVIHEILNKA